MAVCRATRSVLALLAAAAAALWPPAQALAAIAEPVVVHTLAVRIDPETHHLQVHDRLTIPGGLVSRKLELVLNDALVLNSAAPRIELQLMRRHVTTVDAGMDRSGQTAESTVRVNVYRIRGALPGRELVLDLAYQGRINHPVGNEGPGYARSFAESPGLIETRGVYLAGATHWVPEIGTARLRYQLEADLPAGWTSVSQGVRDAVDVRPGPGGRHHDVWRVDTPTEQVHLIAARFTEYGRDAGPVKVYAFLRTADPGLAARYLEATGRYLAMYQSALGPYPYGKFALVENFWETGYGMPSFTLLGEQVIRLPFILTTSYPHELLHNWWGNGVFVDFAGGNWCEGLTAYLADHLSAEQKGLGAEHRRDILERVTDYVTPQADFPLHEFLARRDATTEAIGYGKAAMVWNMLRARLGDARFLASLQRFYRQHQFTRASFEDLRQAFEETSGEDLRPFFRQWIDGTGVPELQLSAATRSGTHLTVTVAQVQEGARFALDVPLAIHTAQGVVLRTIALDPGSASATASFMLDAAPTRVDVDPQFQVFRRLSPLETPPSLSKAFGANRVLIVVAAAERNTIYRGLLEAWTRAGVEIAADSDLTRLPEDRPVWILGRSNRFLPDFAADLGRQGAALDAEGLQIGDRRYPAQEKSLVATARSTANPAAVRIFVSAPSAAAATGLARKLPHYGKYSWLVFAGAAPDNEAKGEWTVGGSALSHVFESGAVSFPLPTRHALFELPAPIDAARLRADVDWLAAPEREGRGIGTQGIEAAARYIANAFQAAGLEPLADNGYFQDFTLTGRDGQKAVAHNVLGVLRGSNPAFARQSLVISAHYDHLGFGWPDAHAGDLGHLHPGADDNASGVAVLIELARVLADAHPDRSIVFAAFSGEEEGLLGSRAYVARAREPDARYPLSGAIADLNLDTVGRLEGGTLAVFGADSAREWPFIFGGVTATTGIPVQVVARAVDASDHAAFVDAGVPAVQLFASTTEDYHRPGDTPDKIDIVGMTRVALVLKETTDYLAARPDPLHYTGQAQAGRAPTGDAPAGSAAPGGVSSAGVPAVGVPSGAGSPGAGQVRRASTGVVPDMSYEGAGVRVASVVPGSGADVAGLQAGDRVISLAGLPIADLKALAAALKTLQPGDNVEIGYVRESRTETARLTLGER